MKKKKKKKKRVLLFSTIFSIYLLLQEPNYIFICEMWLFGLFFSAVLICRGTDISKYVRESLGLRNNENRLYITSLSLGDLGRLYFLTVTISE